MIRKQLSKDFLTDIQRQPHRLRHFCLLENGSQISKNMMSNFFEFFFNIKQQFLYERYLQVRPHHPQLMLTQKEKQRLNVASFIFNKLGRSDEQLDPYIFYVHKLRGRSSRNNPTIKTLSICDGAVIIIPLFNVNYPWLKTMCSLIVSQCIQPVYYIDLRQAIERKGSNQTIRQQFGKIIEVIETQTKLSKERNTKNCIKYFCDKNNIILGTSLIDQGLVAISISQYLEISIKSPVQKNLGHQSFQKSNLQDLLSISCEIIEILSKIHHLSCKTNELWWKNKVLSQHKILLLEKEIPGLQLKSLFNSSTNIFKIVISVVPSPIDNNAMKLSLFLGNCNQLHFDGFGSHDPLIIYAPKQQCFSQITMGYRNSSSYFYGRILSGKCLNNQTVTIHQIGLKGTEKKNCDLRVMSMYDNKICQALQVGAGNLVVLKKVTARSNTGLYITKLQDPTDLKRIGSLNIKNNSVRLKLQPKKACDLPKLLEQALKLWKQLEEVTIQHNQIDMAVLSSDRQLLQEFLQDLTKQVQVQSRFQPIFKEIITTSSSQLAFVKSPNKHNRLYGFAQPISAQMFNFMEIEKSYQFQEKDWKKCFEQEFNWMTQKDGYIWSFGGSRQNLLVDKFSPMVATQSYLHEIRQSAQQAFCWVTKQAILCQQNLAKTKFNIVDCDLISDAIHRGGGQIIPSCRRLFYASQILAQPTLVEPYVQLKLKLNTQFQMLQKLLIENGLMQFSHIEMVQKIQNQNGIQNLVIVEIPSIEYKSILYGGISSIEEQRCVWKPIGGLGYQQGSKANKIIKSLRLRKGLRGQLPNLNEYADKI